MNKQVYVGMCADIIHPGHINIIIHARKLGDVVIGILTDDAMIDYKRVPYMSLKDRKLIIENIVGVKKVVFQDSLDYTSNLRKYKPDYVVHGDDWKTGIQCETRKKVIDVLKEWGGQLVEVEYTDGVSSTKLYNAIKKEEAIYCERRKRLITKEG